MKLTFFGAAHEVTGSCTLLEVGNSRILIDCGMEQGKDMFENQQLPISPAEIDAVLLTHAHIDHAGNLPLLTKGGFRGSVYTTEATVSLSEIMLRDTAHIQEFEAEWRDRKAKRAGGQTYQPVYTMADAVALLGRMRPCRYGERIRILENVEIRFSDAGHLLGSACIEVFLREGGEERTIVFSGDLGSHDRPILKNPQTIAHADYVMIESTYGDRLHTNRPAEGNHVAALTEILNRTFRRGGNVVIPSFAVGRTQEILYDLRAIKEKGLVTAYPGFKVYMDSPLAGEATCVFMQCGAESMDGEAAAILSRGVNPFWFEGLVCAESSAESKAINRDPAPKVIISASGMCEAGRIRHHLKHNLWRKESTILFVGYQTPGTLGRAIWDGARSVRLFGEDVVVAAEIATLSGISGHADQSGLLRWLAGFAEKPQAVFVNHGDDDAVDAFVALLRERGYQAYAPFSGTTFDLITGQPVLVTEGVPVNKKAAARAAQLHDALIQAAEELLVLSENSRGRPNRELSAMAERIRALIKQYQ